MVCGVGSGGTITGLSNYFAEHCPETEMVLADPEGSILTHYVETGEVSTDVGSWMVEGIGRRLPATHHGRFEGQSRLHGERR